MGKVKYRIVPTTIFAFALQKRGWMWWRDVSWGDDYDELAEAVKRCDGVLVNWTPPSKPEGNPHGA